MVEKNNKLSRKDVKEQLKNLIKEFQKKIVKTLQDKINKKNAKNKLKNEDFDSLQEAINYLRMCIKYTLFDLEATRRENKILKKLLEEK